MSEGAGPASQLPADVAPPARPPGFRAAVDRLVQGPRSTWVVWTFGIVAPPVLLWAERPVTHSWGLDALPLRPFTSTLAFAGAGTVLAWRLVRTRAGARVAGFLAGALGAAACGAAGIGLLLLPKSVIGLLFVFGTLGFVPFVSAWACFGATVESLRRAVERAPLHQVVFFALLGGCTLLGGSWAGARAAMRVERRYQDQILSGRESPRARPVLKVLWWIPGVALRDLHDAARVPRDPASVALLDITGLDPSEDPRRW